MKFEDLLVKNLIIRHGELLDNHDRTASGWWLNLKDCIEQTERHYNKKKIVFGKDQRIAVTCEVADSEDLQILGLNRHASLHDTEGMIFPYNPPQKISFHMSEVQFPIDMIFVGSDGRITKLVENIDPGTPGSWGMDHISAVIEVNGGFSNKHNIEVGLDVFELLDKQGQLTALSPETAVQLYPEAVEALSQIWPNVSGVEFYVYMDTLGAAPMESDDPEVYWDGDQWQVFNGPKLAKLADEDMSLESQLKRLSSPEVNYMELEDIGDGTGFACKNCRFATTSSFCDNEKVKAYVSPRRGCCNLFEPTKKIPRTEDEWSVHKLNKKEAQETYPRYTRPDINPKMTHPNRTRERFRDRDLIDNQVKNQPFDPAHREEAWGYDPVTYHEEDPLSEESPAPVRMSELIGS